jgi:hypothetical protein
MSESKWPLGVLGSQVSQECTCTFDPISLHSSVLAIVNPSCPEHGTAAMRRLEKIALYPLRYSASPEQVHAWVDANPPLSRWQRFKRWINAGMP